MILALLAMLLLVSGCGTLIGNVKPIEKKANDYAVADLAKENSPSWTRIKDPSLGDSAFESQLTGAVIAAHSSCRERAAGPPPGSAALESRLRNKSQELSRGMTDIQLLRERSLLVDSQPALARTLLGKMPAESGATAAIGPVVLQSVVLQRGGCSYQLMSVSTPEAFSATQEAFSRFVGSFSFSAPPS